MNKTDIDNAIATINNDGDNTALEVRTVLETIRDAFYSDAVSDDNSTETYTSSNANFTYDIKFFKSGGTITMNGTFTANNSISSNSSTLIFNIDNADYQGSGNSVAKGSSFNNNETVVIKTISNLFVMNGGMLANESFNFSITYNADN